MKVRLDQLLAARGIVASRSQAESYIRLGKVSVDGRVVTKPGYFANEAAEVQLAQDEQYVSRAGMKLASVASALNLDFTDKVVLDVGSSTGGFTDFALRRGARKVIAVDVGTDQLHKKLRSDARIELYEKTDIRNVVLAREVQDVPLKASSIGNDNTSNDFTGQKVAIEVPDMILADVSFISLREILPTLTRLSGHKTEIIVMLKPQFEGGARIKNAGVVKNDHMRREILRNFEIWTRRNFMIVAKADSDVAGEKGNRERFYSLRNL